MSYRAALDGESAPLDPQWAALCAGLEALATPLLLVDDGGRVAYLTQATAQLLGLAAGQIVGQAWPAVWAALCPAGRMPAAEPRRTAVRRGTGVVPVRAWQRPVAGAPLQLVGLEDLAAEDAQEREVLRIFQDAQQQADDLFALYQITQFLNMAQELDQLCAIFLRELTHLTSAELAVLYLATPGGLQPKVWHGLTAGPPPAADGEAAAAWFRAQAGDFQTLVLPLLAAERLIGLAVLAHPGASNRESRFLHTVAKEMGTALLVMAGRQALFSQEQKLEAIVNGTTDAIIQVGADQQVCDFNHAAELLTGYTAAEAMAGSCAAVLGCAAGAGCAGACPFAQVLMTHEPITYTELLVAGRAGRHPAAASVAALDLGGATAPTAVAILRDISRQKQIEQMKDNFLATVSHQLRTPLALLRGYTDTLLHLELSPDEQRACITGIADTTARLGYLVEQVLDVTRIEDGRLELDLEPVRLVDVIRAAITALPHAAYRSRIWTNLASDLPPVEADLQRLEQVLINLLDNALKYSPPSGQVVIRGRHAGDMVEVQVLDEGIGVPPEDQAAIFDKFHRAGNARARQVPGTGLGLFICRSIVEAHHGQITLDSPPGAGTCVTFRLPVSRQGA